MKRDLTSVRRLVTSPHPGVLIVVLLCGFALQALASEHRPLVAAASSPEEFARRFLDALDNNDRDAALALAITREEFDRYVWPELPVAEPERNVPAGFIWNTTNMRGLVRLGSAFASLGGHRMVLEEIRFTGGVEEYETYRIHRNSQLVLTDEEGERKILRLFGSVLELDGQFKIYSFNYD